jgi:hypothetical protein
VKVGALALGVGWMAMGWAIWTRDPMKEGEDKMRSVLIAGVACLVALAGPAQAATPKHKWVMLNYATGTCEPMTMTPEQIYTAMNAAGDGTSIDQIGPDAVTKSATGDIHVHMTGRIPAGPRIWDVFTDRKACEQYFKDEGIAPQQAPDSDIN